MLSSDINKQCGESCGGGLKITGRAPKRRSMVVAEGGGKPFPVRSGCRSNSVGRRVRRCCGLPKG
eukprot:2485414-Amphidinium_carterae.1